MAEEMPVISEVQQKSFIGGGLFDYSGDCATF